MSHPARIFALAALCASSAALAACSSSGGGHKPAEQASHATDKPVVLPLSQFTQVINGDTSAANQKLHDTLCDQLVGTTGQISRSYLGGQAVRELSFTTGGDGMECAYSLDPASSLGDEGAAKDLVVSVAPAGTSNTVPGAPTDYDATSTGHGVTIRVQRSEKAQLSAEALAQQLLTRVSK